MIFGPARHTVITPAGFGAKMQCITMHWNVEPAVQSSVFNRHVIHTTEIVSDNVQGQTQHTKLITYTIVEGQNIQNIFTA